MSFELAFRTSFFVAAFLSVLYTRTLVAVTAVLAVTAYLFYGHPAGNPAWQEALIFAWTWAAAVAAAWLVAPKTHPQWPVFYEWSLAVAHLRRDLKPADGVTWVCALVVGVASYAALELVGYDRGTFYRLQSFVWLLLLMLAVFVFETVTGRKESNFFPADEKRRHIWAMGVLAVALLIDIMVRDSGIYRFLLPALGSVLALGALRWWLVSVRGSDRLRHAKKA